MRLALKRKIPYAIIFIIVIIIYSCPEMRGVRPYEYISKENILDNLHEELATNFTSAALSDCDYEGILLDETILSPSLVDGDLMEGYRIREGGEYAPAECKPKYSTAVIVPYRDRAEELRGFLVYMHNFLRHQRIHYRIYVIEQLDTHPFNRAKLLNIGAKTAMKAGYPCLILHDVDLIPLKPANLYVCSKLPRHMSSSINKFRFVLPYLNLFGGVIAMVSKQYKAVNGMTNEYGGSGRENEDLYMRLASKELAVCRFEPEISRYHSMGRSTEHKYDKTNMARSEAGAGVGAGGSAGGTVEAERMARDGLTSVRYTQLDTVMHPLFTHIMADL